jgi:HD-GYP domain-containing protein (c-di-GMP phosphodiesterase class II)
MPLLLTCQDLQPGMRLAEAFVWRGRVMLPGGKVLSDSDVSVLRRSYGNISVKVGDPVLDGLVEFEDDAPDRQVAVAARQKIAACVSDVQQRFAQHASLASVNFLEVKSAASDVIDFIAQNPASAALLDLSVDPNSPLSGHTGNVFYLSIVLGSAVREYVIRERRRQTSCTNLSSQVAMDLLPLGLGAMFMDVGMYELQHLYAPGYEMTETDRDRVRAHPGKGADLLPDSLPAGTKMVVRTHHENFDGSGYPTGQSASSLHVFTRIVRICDAFVAATGNRPHRGAKSPARTIWEMSAGPYKGCYDPVLMRVFTGLIQPFPIGAKVRLADGRHAVVVRYNRTDPFRPTGIVAFAPDGSRLPEGQVVGPVTLGSNDGLRLAAFDGEDLSFLYNGVRPGTNEWPDPSVSRVFRTLVDVGYP